MICLKQMICWKSRDQKNCQKDKKNCQKNKDLDLYNYFSPKTREYLFTSFSHSGTKLERLKENIKATEIKLTQEEVESMNEALSQMDIENRRFEPGSDFEKRVGL